MCPILSSQLDASSKDLLRDIVDRTYTRFTSEPHWPKRDETFIRTAISEVILSLFLGGEDNEESLRRHALSYAYRLTA
jgi:hypothetical protein